MSLFRDYRVTDIESGESLEFSEEHGCVYQLDDAYEVEVSPIPIWCFECRQFSSAEEIESIEEARHALEAIHDPSQQANLIPLSFRRQQQLVDRIIAHTQRRYDWLLARRSPAKCLKCFKASFAALTIAVEQPHPATGRRIRIEQTGVGFARLVYKTFLTAEGDPIQTIRYHGPDFTLCSYADPIAFRDATMPTLLEHEPENARIISLVVRLAEAGIESSNPKPRLWTITTRSRVEIVGVQRPGERFEATRGPTEAAQCLADALAEEGDVDAIVGVCPSIQIIVNRFAGLTGRKPSLVRRLSGHETSQVVLPAPVSGSMRLCAPEDRQVLLEFLAAYTIAINEPTKETARLVDELIDGKRIYFWCDPYPVAMAGWAGPTPNGIRINSVFTPTEFRNRGYASNLVTQFTRKLLDDGRRSVFLFTDQSNPRAARIYERIGYRCVSSGEHWTFDPRPRELVKRLFERRR